MSAIATEVREFVVQYFSDEPTAPVDACVRDALSLGIPVTPDLISGIRKDMRMLKIAPPLTPSLADKPPSNMGTRAIVSYVKTPSKPPQWFIDKQKKDDEYFRKQQAASDEDLTADLPVELSPIKARTTRKPDKPREKDITAMLERRHYYDSILLDDPTQSVTCAMRKVTAKFGRSVNPGYAVESLRIVRALAGVTKEMVVLRDNKPLTHRITIPTSNPVTKSEPKVPVPIPPPLNKPTDELYAVLYKTAHSNTESKTDIVSKADLGALLQRLSSQNIVCRVFKEIKVKVTVTVDFE